jgi:hypothetical protein
MFDSYAMAELEAEFNARFDYVSEAYSGEGDIMMDCPQDYEDYPADRNPAPRVNLFSFEDIYPWERNPDDMIPF